MTLKENSAITNKREGENGRKEQKIKIKNNTVQNKNEMNHGIDQKIFGCPDTYNSLVWNIVTKKITRNCTRGSLSCLE